MAAADIKLIVYREAPDGLKRVGTVTVPGTSTKPQADGWRKFLANTEGVPEGEYAVYRADSGLRFQAKEKRSTASTDLGVVQ